MNGTIRGHQLHSTVAGNNMAWQALGNGEYALSSTAGGVTLNKVDLTPQINGTTMLFLYPDDDTEKKETLLFMNGIQVYNTDYLVVTVDPTNKGVDLTPFQTRTGHILVTGETLEIWYY